MLMVLISAGDTHIKPDPRLTQTERPTSWPTVNVETLQSDWNKTGNILQPRRGPEREQTRPGESKLCSEGRPLRLWQVYYLSLHYTQKTDEQNP